MLASVDPKRCQRNMTTTAASSKPPPSKNLRPEELSLDDRANGSRSKDDLDDNSGSCLLVASPSAKPVDEVCCSGALFLTVPGRGMRVPMKRKVSSSVF